MTAKQFPASKKSYCSVDCGYYQHEFLMLPISELGTKYSECTCGNGVCVTDAVPITSLPKGR